MGKRWQRKTEQTTGIQRRFRWGMTMICLGKCLLRNKGQTWKMLLWKLTNVRQLWSNDHKKLTISMTFPYTAVSTCVKSQISFRTSAVSTQRNPSKTNSASSDLQASSSKTKQSTQPVFAPSPFLSSNYSNSRSLFPTQTKAQFNSSSNSETTFGKSVF